MIVALGMLLMFIGAAMMSMDLFVPFPSFLFMVVVMNRLLGLVFFVFGVILIGVRIHQVGVAPLLDLPRRGRVILFHQRRGRHPNTSLLSGKLRDLEFIKTKNKLIVDTGGGFRIAGHDCRRTFETICAEIPEWFTQYVYDMKRKFGIDNLDAYRQLKEAFATLEPYKKVMEYDEKTQKEVERIYDIEQQLEQIELLKPAMKDPKMRSEILAMPIDKLKKLELAFFDGETHHSEDVERWIESATPNELDALEKQEYLNDAMRDRNYTDPGEINWGKWVPYIVFLLLGGAIAAIMIKGAFGG